MDIKRIKSQYYKLLGFNYGNIELLISTINESIDKLTTCKGINNPKVLRRLKEYRFIKNYAKTKL